MTVGRKRAASAPKEQEIELLRALKFVSVGSYAPGDTKAQADYQQHCMFANGQVTTFNGVIAAGYPIGDEMDACPNTYLLMRALEKVRGAYALTVLNNNQLSITAGKFRALVPCVAQYNMQMVEQDAPNYALDDKIKDAAKIAGMFSTDGAQTVLQASIITRDFSFVGTNGMAMVETYHGNHMPPGLLIPVSFFEAVAKVPTTIVRFGYTPERSLTVYFENGAWLRTQLYLEGVPDVAKILDPLQMERCVDLPDDFWSSCDAVAPHSVNRTLFFDNNRVMSHETDTIGAQHQLDAPFRKSTNYDLLRKFMNHCQKADFVSHDDKVVFAGDTVRGVVMCKRWD